MLRRRPFAIATMTARTVTSSSPHRSCPVRRLSLDLNYNDLAQEPKAVVEKLYAHFGWTMSDAFLRDSRRQRMASEGIKVNIIILSRSSGSQRSGSRKNLAHYSTTIHWLADPKASPLWEAFPPRHHCVRRFANRLVMRVFVLRVGLRSNAVAV